MLGATSNKYTLPLQVEIAKSKQYFRIHGLANITDEEYNELYLRITQDYCIISTIHIIHNKIEHSQGLPSSGTNMCQEALYHGWMAHYPTIFTHIVTFSDYIEYINWHYQSDIDKIFNAVLTSVSA